jgi:hypothetical protein
MKEYSHESLHWLAGAVRTLLSRVAVLESQLKASHLALAPAEVLCLDELVAPISCNLVVLPGVAREPTTEVAFRPDVFEWNLKAAPYRPLATHVASAISSVNVPVVRHPYAEAPHVDLRLRDGAQCLPGVTLAPPGEDGDEDNDPNSDGEKGTEVPSAPSVVKIPETACADAAAAPPPGPADAAADEDTPIATQPYSDCLPVGSTLDPAPGGHQARLADVSPHAPGGHQAPVQHFDFDINDMPLEDWVRRDTVAASLAARLRAESAEEEVLEWICDAYPVRLVAPSISDAFDTLAGIGSSGINAVHGEVFVNVCRVHGERFEGKLEAGSLADVVAEVILEEWVDKHLNSGMLRSDYDGVLKMLTDAVWHKLGKTMDP